MANSPKPTEEFAAWNVLHDHVQIFFVFKCAVTRIRRSK